MILFHIKSRLDDPELEAAIELMSNEHPATVRNTPIKMSNLISSELDVEVDVSRISKFFGLEEDYSKESLKIEHL